MLLKFMIKFRLIPLIVAALTLSGCNGDAGVKKDPAEAQKIVLAFPPAPETPRFYYETTLLHSGQFHEQSDEGRWRELLTGEKSSANIEGMSKPYDVEACGGRVYVSDTVARHIAVFDFNNRNYFTFGDEEPGLLRKPLGLGSDTNCNIYVADITQSSIFMYDSGGRFIRAIGGADWFHRLSHVAVNPEGTRVYAVDTGGVQTDEHRIRVFDSQSGQHLFDIGKRGKEDGEFNLPKDIDVGADGKVYVVDSGNFRVQVFEADGKFIRAFGSIGDRLGQFSRPKGIASDADGNIYVADTSLSNVQIFNAEGELLMYIGGRTKDNQPAGYMLPSGVDVDADGRIFFADQFFRKIDIFRPAGLLAEAGVIGAVLHPQPGP